MYRMLATMIAIGMLAGTARPAFAVDGHGNAENIERTVPNSGNVVGGPAHRNDPRIQESRERGPNGKPAHHDNDGHAHGHSHGKN